ncbi:TlpA family protein disulfide reductase [Caldinitratiruptor microaerophilus]|uniref:Thioredoxin domain-containing protein n=1 Tax=Caldinitratiruptor microaerophilus TaxID=671077 RepID=A0AA35CND8_9FIRM|nr:TlpA disulfide reductase family protein [Caldinitratiruptor microaerophilus]BDG61674.1 hypothetical protein caldi_27640 [Caldinitratiruptor microaerophilus]
MQRWLNIAAGALVALALLGGVLRPSALPGGGQVRPEPGYLAPEIAGQSPDGQPMRLSALRGKAVFVNFWASWCPPCRLEMPDIDRLAQDLPEGTAIFTVNATDTESSPDMVRRFLEVTGYRFPVVMDPRGEAMAAYRVSGLPTSFFIDPDGVITRRVTGPLTLQAMQAELQAALRGAPGTTGGGAWTLPQVPETVSVGGAQVRVSILLLILGAVLAAALSAPALRRRGLPAGAADDLLIGLLLGGFLGSRVAAVVADPVTYLTHPATLLAATGGTAAWVGSTLGVALGAGWALRRFAREPSGRRDPERPRRVLDTLAAPLLAGGAVAAAGAVGLGAAAGLALAAAGTARLGRSGRPGHAALGAAVFASLGLVLGDFFRLAPVVWGGLSALQITATVVGLAAAWLAGRLARPAGGDPPASPLAGAAGHGSSRTNA